MDYAAKLSSISIASSRRATSSKKCRIGNLDIVPSIPVDQQHLHRHLVDSGPVQLPSLPNDMHTALPTASQIDTGKGKRKRTTFAASNIMGMKSESDNVVCLASDDSDEEMDGKPPAREANKTVEVVSLLSDATPYPTPEQRGQRGGMISHHQPSSEQLIKWEALAKKRGCPDGWRSLGGTGFGECGGNPYVFMMPEHEDVCKMPEHEGFSGHASGRLSLEEMERWMIYHYQKEWRKDEGDDEWYSFRRIKCCICPPREVKHAMASGTLPMYDVFTHFQYYKAFQFYRCPSTSQANLRLVWDVDRLPAMKKALKVLFKEIETSGIDFY